MQRAAHGEGARRVPRTRVLQQVCCRSACAPPRRARPCGAARLSMCGAWGGDGCAHTPPRAAAVGGHNLVSQKDEFTRTVSLRPRAQTASHGPEVGGGGGGAKGPPPNTATTVIAKGATTRRATGATAATHAALSQSPLSTTMAEAGGKTPAPLTERPFSKTQLFCSNLPWSVNGKVSHRPQAASHTQGARRESRA